MKSFLTGVFILLSVTLFSHTRIYILTETVQQCKIDLNEIKIFGCGTEMKMAGIFIIDDYLSEVWGVETIMHMTPTADSDYYIQKIQNNETSTITEVISDTGNKYTLLFDWKNDIVTAVYMNDNIPNSNRNLVRWKIANVLFVKE